MKKLHRIFAVVLLCGTTAFMIACNQAGTGGDTACEEVRTTELVRTSQSWDGVDLPDYLQGRPELVAIKYEIPAGKKLGWHHHPVMNFGILVEGELTIISADGTEKVVHAGEAVVEMVGTVHHGENRGTQPVVLYMFYNAQEDMPLTIPDPEPDNL